jgi:hypothetical protein
VARERQRAEPADGEVVLRVEAQGAPEDALGLRIPGRVAGLARSLLVGETEEDVGVLVARVRPQARLEVGDERLGAGVERETFLEVLCRLRSGEGS